MTEMEIFLLALLPRGSGKAKHELHPAVEQILQDSFLTGSKIRFPFCGLLRKANLIPLDKFKKWNILWFLQYTKRWIFLFDHTAKCNFLDKKHIINKDALPTKGRSNPLTRYINFILVTGDFQEP
jgi:hypothetical protein